MSPGYCRLQRTTGDTAGGADTVLGRGTDIINLDPPLVINLHSSVVQLKCLDQTTVRFRGDDPVELAQDGAITQDHADGIGFRRRTGKLDIRKKIHLAASQVIDHDARENGIEAGQQAGSGAGQDDIGSGLGMSAGGRQGQRARARDQDTVVAPIPGSPGGVQPAEVGRPEATAGADDGASESNTRDMLAGHLDGSLVNESNASRQYLSIGNHDLGLRVDEDDLLAQRGSCSGRRSARMAGTDDQYLCIL